MQLPQKQFTCFTVQQIWPLIRLWLLLVQVCWPPLYPVPLELPVQALWGATAVHGLLLAYVLVVFTGTFTTLYEGNGCVGLLLCSWWATAPGSSCQHGLAALLKRQLSTSNMMVFPLDHDHLLGLSLAGIVWCRGNQLHLCVGVWVCVEAWELVVCMFCKIMS